ncbi:coiled-coil domain-containing protein 194 [Podarcis muralis]
MDPSAIKATLKVLGWCAVVLLVLAAVTVTVAVMAWHSEAARQLRRCREQVANETAALGDKVAELERERAGRKKQLEKLAQREKDLQKQLGQAKESRKRLNATLMDCLENVTLLDANLTALHGEMFTLQAEGVEMDSQNSALLAEMSWWRQKATGLEERLEAAAGEKAAAEAEREHCEARQAALQESVHGYLSEIASLHRRLQGRPSSSGRRCPPFRYLLWGLAIFFILDPLERLIFLL